MKPSELYDADNRLVACLPELPFQEGRPLSPIQEESLLNMVLIEYTSDTESSDRNVFMADIGPDIEISDR